MTGGQNHNADFQQLIERRRKFIEGLDANKDEINLDIFEDFYPDRAHFVYELLQNAEDAGATKVAFTLLSDRLICEHDGRPFTIDDVNSITGLHNSTKVKDQDQIGKFGVGFKSVFVYTQTPSILSGSFAFRIQKKVLPEQIAPASSIGNRTRFEFPFDNPKKPQRAAYGEIAAGFDELDERTLLFLTNLQSVKWLIEGNASGEVQRVQHSDFHFEVLKEAGEKQTSTSHFLKFDEIVPNLGKQRVAVAFSLDALPGVREFERTKPLLEQFKIVRASPGSVAVFFPAVKETSGLRFHLHGPFLTGLDRASIKDAPANLPLFEQLASLAAQSLHRIKGLGLLNTEFLAVLPNPQDSISPRYAGIRSVIVEEMKSQPLTPTHGRGHAPANRLIQAKASLKSLLSEDDIAFLVDYEDQPPLWAVGATQRNQSIDNFLTGLNIRQWDISEFIDTFCEKADENSLFSAEPDEKFMEWLALKEPSWMQELYALLNSEAQDEVHQLESLRIVRLADGTFANADHAFFASDSTGDDLPVVDSRVYTSPGTTKKQQGDAKAFLSLLGVREIGEAEEIEIILKSRYTQEAEIPSNDVYLNDLKRFVALVEKEPDKARLFAEFRIFKGEDNDWYCPKDVYLDQPFKQTDLSAYYSRLGADSDSVALHPNYKDCGITIRQLQAFAEIVGVTAKLKIISASCQYNPQWAYLRSVRGDRYTSPYDRDYYVPKLAELLTNPSLELSRLIWRTLASFTSDSDYLNATFRRNYTGGTHYAHSRLVHELRTAKWIPQGDGIFVRPADASQELLPKGFPFDPGYAWLEAIKFGETAEKSVAQATQRDTTARSLGFADSAALDRARRINELMSEDEQEEFLAELESRHNKGAIPDRPLANPDRRSKNVHEQALNAPDKETETRERSVPIGRKNVKELAKSYLREHYRNADGDMTCQICKHPLPFNMDDGEGHFETVAFLPELLKEHPQNYLALCPNHAAMYQLVNGSRETMREEFQAFEGNQLSVVLAEKDMSIYFSKTHIIDLKAVLDAEDSLPAEQEVPSDDSLTGTG